MKTVTLVLGLILMACAARAGVGVVLQVDTPGSFWADSSCTGPQWPMEMAPPGTLIENKVSVLQGRRVVFEGATIATARTRTWLLASLGKGLYVVEVRSKPIGGTKAGCVYRADMIVYFAGDDAPRWDGAMGKASVGYFNQ